MIDPQLLKALYKAKYGAVRAARKRAMERIAHFGIVQKTDDDIWEDFLEGGPQGLQMAQGAMPKAEMTDYMQTLTRIAGKRGPAARAYLGQAKKMAG